MSAGQREKTQCSVFGAAERDCRECTRIDTNWPSVPKTIRRPTCKNREACKLPPDLRTSLENAVVHDDVHLYRDGMSVLPAGFEAPFRYGLNGFFVEAVAQGPLHSNVFGTPVNVNHRAQDHHAHVLDLARFF